MLGEGLPASLDSALYKPAFFVSADGDIRSPLEAEYKLIILNYVQDPAESLFEVKVADLFSKMLSAMKLKPGSFLVVDCLMNERPLIPAEAQRFFKASHVLMFSSHPDQLSEFHIRGGFQWLETFSPAYLLKHPEAKKLVWNDMQKVMGVLS